MNKLKNKNVKIISVIVALVGISAIAFFTAQNNSQNEAGYVIAKVNGKPIYSSEAEVRLSALNKGIKGIKFESLDDNIKKLLIEGVAAQKLLLKEAYSNGIAKTDAVKNKVSIYRDQVVKDEFLAKMAKEAITNENLQIEYNNIAKALKGKMEYKTRHILVKTEKEAKTIIRRLSREKFGKVAKKLSIDKETAITGGDLGYVLSGTNLDKGIEEALVALKDGDYSSKPVQSKFGWHILKREGSRPAQVPEFDKIKASLANQLFNKTINSHVQNLLTDAKLEIIEVAKDKSSSDKTPFDKDSQG